MATCPSCEAPDLEVDEYELEEGEVVTCPECGVSLEVMSVSPVELEVISEKDEDDEDDEEDEDAEDDDEELDALGDDDEREDMDE